MEDIEKIIASLTPEEKIKLLGGQQGGAQIARDGDIYGVPRVEISPLKFADGPVGVHWWTKASTCYPALICLAATFDEDTAFKYGESVGKDCRAAGVHVLLAPGVNLYRSPLCGRNFEYLGEDPELAGQLAAAYIRGVQSQNVAATVKHFAANNQEYDRHGISSDIDERTLREVYLRAFELAVKEGKVACVMTSYNLLNGQHCSENFWLISEVLRKEWGFEGVVMSDWDSVYSTAQTINAGLDLEMPFAKFLTEKNLLPLLENGVVDIEILNERIRNRLRLMKRFGWLDPKHKQKDANIPARNPETEAVALDVAKKGIVMLKNDSLLPKKPGSIKKITLLGYHAGNPVICGGGSAYTPPHESITLLDSIKKIYGDTAQIEWFECIDLWREDAASKYMEFLTPDKQTGGLKAEYFENNNLEGSPVLTRIDKYPCFEWKEILPDKSMNCEHFSVRWTGFFKVEKEAWYDIYLSLSGAGMDIWLDDKPVMQKIFDSRRFSMRFEAGLHSIRIDFREYRRNWCTCKIGMEPSENAIENLDTAVASAKNSDIAIVTAGFVTRTEGEGHDRNFELDFRLNKLISMTADANPNTAVILYCGGACDITPWLDKVKSILCLWYPGQNGALAAAEIIAGITNPSGKLPFTWEKRAEDRGSFNFYHDADGDKRVAYGDGIFTGYRWFDKHAIAPLFHFGHGLSYTCFEYDNLRTKILSDKSVALSFDITNIGKCDGYESALVFVGDDEASSPRPLRELKATRRVFLEAGEKTTVSLTLPPRAFAFWDSAARKWMIESGSFTIYVGSNAANLPLTGKIKMDSVRVLTTSKAELSK